MEFSYNYYGQLNDHIYTVGVVLRDGIVSITRLLYGIYKIE
jgi:hypothetical protein